MKLKNFHSSRCNLIFQYFVWESWKIFQARFTKYVQSNFCYGDNQIFSHFFIVTHERLDICDEFKQSFTVFCTEKHTFKKIYKKIIGG